MIEARRAEAAARLGAPEGVTEAGGFGDVIDLEEETESGLVETIEGSDN